MSEPAKGGGDHGSSKGGNIAMFAVVALIIFIFVSSGIIAAMLDYMNGFFSIIRRNFQMILGIAVLAGIYFGTKGKGGGDKH